MTPINTLSRTIANKTYQPVSGIPVRRAGNEATGNRLSARVGPLYPGTTKNQKLRPAIWIRAIEGHNDCSDIAGQTLPSSPLSQSAPAQPTSPLPASSTLIDFTVRTSQDTVQRKDQSPIFKPPAALDKSRTGANGGNLLPATPCPDIFTVSGVYTPTATATIAFQHILREDKRRRKHGPRRISQPPGYPRVSVHSEMTDQGTNLPTLQEFKCLPRDEDVYTSFPKFVKYGDGSSSLHRLSERILGGDNTSKAVGLFGRRMVQPDPRSTYKPIKQKTRIKFQARGARYPVKPQFSTNTHSFEAFPPFVPTPVVQDETIEESDDEREITLTDLVALARARLSNAKKSQEGKRTTAPVLIPGDCGILGCLSCNEAARRRRVILDPPRRKQNQPMHE
jgi:hypothetical protein